MKTHRLVLGSIAIALATAMATTAAAQDPEQGSKKPVATKKAPVAKAPAAKKADAKAGKAEAAPDDAANADEAAPPEDEAAAEAGEASDDAAEAEAAPDEDAGEAEESPEVPKATPVAAPAASPDKPKAAAVPPTYYGPAELEFVEGGTIPPGYIKDTRIRKGLVIGGAITWGVGWLAAATAAAGIVKEEDRHSDEFQNCTYTATQSYCREEDHDEVSGAAALFVPLVGPFIAMYTMRHDVEGAGNAALFLDGMIQVTGFSLLVAGAAAKKTVLVRDPGASVAFTPGPGGAMLTGSF